jgi:iron complex transport system substrate-binding protein
MSENGPRLVSLVPSITEILFELGVGDRVVGVSHQCRYPPQAREKPSLTRDRISLDDLARAAGGLLGDGTPSSAAIDEAYTRFRAAAGSPYALDVQLLNELAPDVIFDQGLCDVCAIGETQVDVAARVLAPAPPLVVTISPTTLGEILESIRTIGEAARVPERAEALVQSLAARVEAVRRRAARAASRPRVFCLEWLDPIWCAGHWVPEMVALAGGEDRLGQPGAPSVRVAWERVVAEAPEVLVLMPCSFSVRRTLQELPALARRPGWAELPAVRHGRVWVVESGYFSHHSHRTVEGLEMLAHAIHPELFPNRWGEHELVRLGSLHPLAPALTRGEGE